jgi:hypothetical protein
LFLSGPIAGPPPTGSTQSQGSSARRAVTVARSWPTAFCSEKRTARKAVRAQTSSNELSRNRHKTFLSPVRRSRRKISLPPPQRIGRDSHDYLRWVDLSELSRRRHSHIGRPRLGEESMRRGIDERTRHTEASCSKQRRSRPSSCAAPMLRRSSDQNSDG